MTATRVTLIAAVARNGVIGADGGIPWHLPADFAHFRATTTGHTLVMGRATYDSIGRPLPGRTTIVLTRDPSWTAGPGGDAVLVAASLEQALALATGEVFVAGGATVYAAALPVADAQVISEVELSPPGDTHYPAYPPAADDGWIEVSRARHPASDPAFSVVLWARTTESRRSAEEGHR